MKKQCEKSKTVTQHMLLGCVWMKNQCEKKKTLLRSRVVIFFIATEWIRVNWGFI